MLRGFFTLYYVYPEVLVALISEVALTATSLTTGSWMLGSLSLIPALGLLILALRFKREFSYLHRQLPPPQPSVVLNVRCPLVRAKGGVLDIGDRPVGVPFKVTAMVHNIGRLRAAAVELSLRANGASYRLDRSFVQSFDLEPGEARAYDFTVTPLVASENRSSLLVEARHAGGTETRRLVVRSVFAPEEHPPVRCGIYRWRYGLPAASAWRADIDGFDNLSNEGTLQTAFDLSGLFRIPPSLFISSRLTLDFEEWFRWVQKFPEKMNGEVSRSRFESWLRFLGQIKACNDLEYPLLDQVWPCAQVGNHMYYHYWSPYGYDASQDTSWRRNVAPGEYHHGWQTSEDGGEDALGEIVDNIRLNNLKLKAFFGVEPTTWSAPGNKSHPLYPRALSQAGLVGSSEAVERRSLLGRNIAPYRPDLGVCMPYHPEGSRIVETGAHTRRFDPFTPTQLLSLKRALRRAPRSGSQVTYLWHPHLRQYSPFFGRVDSTKCFPEFLRFLVQDLGSKCWLTTHHNIAQYWESVLCPEHKAVRTSVAKGAASVQNTSGAALRGLPVDVECVGGKRACFLVDLEPYGSRTLP